MRKLHLYLTDRRGELKAANAAAHHPVSPQLPHYCRVCAGDELVANTLGNEYSGRIHGVTSFVKRSQLTSEPHDPSQR